MMTLRRRFGRYKVPARNGNEIIRQNPDSKVSVLYFYLTAKETIMHASTDIRILKCLDGLHYSFELLEFNHSNLYEICCAINKDQSNLIPALSQCWSIIDLAHRIREISQSIPGLSQSNRDLMKFLRRTKVAEDYRHYIQHLRRELSKTSPNPYPVWGSLSWIDPQDNTNSFTAVIGAQIPGTSYAGCWYDTKEKKWVSKVTLAVGNLSFNFDQVYEAINEFRDFILPWILKLYQPGVKLRKDIPIFSVRFKI